MGKKHRISANKLSKCKSFRDLSTNPKTQESFYNSKNVFEHILTFVKQSPNTFSNTCKDLARRCFGLSEPPSGMLCDHVDRRASNTASFCRRVQEGTVHGNIFSLLARGITCFLSIWTSRDPLLPIVAREVQRIMRTGHYQENPVSTARKSTNGVSLLLEQTNVVQRSTRNIFNFAERMNKHSGS